jgi:hypothetical protein
VGGGRGPAVGLMAHPGDDFDADDASE